MESRMDSESDDESNFIQNHLVNVRHTEDSSCTNGSFSDTSTLLPLFSSESDPLVTTRIMTNVVDVNSTILSEVFLNNELMEKTKYDTIEKPSVIDNSGLASTLLNTGDNGGLASDSSGEEDNSVVINEIGINRCTPFQAGKYLDVFSDSSEFGDSTGDTESEESLAASDECCTFEVIPNDISCLPLFEEFPSVVPNFTSVLNLNSTTFEDSEDISFSNLDLQPLFEEFPSVVPNFTSVLNLNSTTFEDSEYIDIPCIEIGTPNISLEIDVELGETGDCHSDTRFSKRSAIKSINTYDVTVLPENISTYPHLLRFVSKRTARLSSLRSTVEDLPKGIDYDYLYDFSRYKKFTEGRPETQVFFQGRIFTYGKLPPFPQNKQKKSKPKSIKKKKNKAVTSSVSDQAPFVLSRSVLNPLAPSFNYHFIDAKDCGTTLKELRVQNVENIVIAHLNINSLRNKFDSLVQLICGNVDILIIGETKLDGTFPQNTSFIIDGFKKPYRKDRNTDGGGVMIYVREDIPSQEKEHGLPSKVEAILVEINLRKSKFLLMGTYHSTHKTYGTTDVVFLQNISTVLDRYSSSYEKFLIAGDFNMQEGEECLDDFLDEFHAKNMVKEPTCFKNPDNPSCIDLFISNSYRSFMKTTAVSTGLSDFHKMIITVMRTTFPKAEPRTIKYRNYSKYSKVAFGNDLGKRLEQQPTNYDTFEEIFLKTLDVHAPQKTKVIRANHKPYVNKKMRKAIMHRSQLQNKLFKYGTIEYQIAFKRQRNYCNRLQKREKKNTTMI